jgi:hypothetical protein
MKNFINRHDVALFAKVFFVMSLTLFIFAAAFNLFLFHTGWINMLCHHVPRPQGGYRGEDFTQVVFQAIPFFILTVGISIGAFELFRHKRKQAKMLAIAFFFLCGGCSLFAQAPGDSRATLFSMQRGLVKGSGYIAFENEGGTVWEKNGLFNMAYWLNAGGDIAMVTIWFDYDRDGMEEMASDYTIKIMEKGKFESRERKSDGVRGYLVQFEGKAVFAYWKDNEDGRLFVFDRQ